MTQDDRPSPDQTQKLFGEPPVPQGGLMKERIKDALFPEQRSAVTIGRFRVLEKLGAGGMGEVYAAYDEHLDRKVAIKLVRPQPAGRGASASERLLREARAMARLSHPNVVQVYEVGVHEGQVFIAMEFIRGVSLDVWLARHARGGEQRWREILDCFLQAGRGLLAAHEMRLMHRDFKPANVLCGDDGRVRVVDFGLARLEQPASEPSASDAGDAADAAIGFEASTIDVTGPDGAAPAPVVPASAAGLARLTATGALVGTPAYMSPEQIDGEFADIRSDQFSFCVALYEALYGTRPYAGRNLVALRLSMESGELAAPVTGQAVPPWIRNALLRGMARDSAARFPGMS